MPGDENASLGMVAVGQWYARISCAACGRGHTRNDLESNAVFRQGLNFLSATSENERIAAFQPKHAFAFLCQVNQYFANLFLRHSVVIGAFSDIDTLGVPAHQIEIPSPISLS